MLLTGCEKNVVKPGGQWLPVPTSRGRGMFACYVDNQTYVSKRQDKVKYNPDTGYLFIHNFYAEFQFRFFIYDGVFGPGAYELDSTGEELIMNFSDTSYGIYSGGVNQLIVDEFNLEKNVVAGTFELNVKNEDGEIIEIRNGRFDYAMEMVD